MIDIAITERGTTATRATLPMLIAIAALFSGTGASAASLKQERDCLALAIYWEARGEGTRGMLAVGWTVLNRVSSRDFPSTPCAA